MSEPRDVKEIVEAYLKKNGYGGLFNGDYPDEPCGCDLGDFIPCGELLSSCEPAQRKPGGPMFPGYLCEFCRGQCEASVCGCSCHNEPKLPLESDDE